MHSQTQTTELSPASKPASLFHNRSYLALMAAQLVSNLGDFMHGLALIWLMNLLTDGNAFWMSMVAVAQVVPRVVIGPFSGVWVDRWKKLLTMRIVDLSAGALALSIALLAYFGQITPLLLLGLTFLLSASTTFFNPAKQVLLTCTVSKEDLLQANSVSQTISTICMLSGPVLAGVLIALAGPYLVFALDGGTFLFSFLCLALVRAIEPKKEVSKQEAPHFWQEFSEGLQAITAIPVVKSTIPIALFINFLFAPINVFLAKLVTDVYRGGAQELGMLESGFGIGMLIGAVTLPLLNKFAKKYAIFFIGLFGSSLAMLLLSLSWNVYIGITAGAVFGLTNMWVNITFGTVIQKLIPQEKMGRVSGLLQTLLTGSQPLSSFAFGLVLNLFVINQLLLLLTGLFFAANLFALTRKPLRQM